MSSGAVGAGMGALGLKKRPTPLPKLQACAALGQSQLVATYQEAFARKGILTAQVLLTHEDLKDHDRHLNARNTLATLMAEGIVPIVNENDAVSYTELKFGDNDALSALVASLLPVDLLIILTTADGVIKDFGTPQAQRLSVIEKIDRQIEALARGTQSITATGGMTTKIQAAKIATRSGIPTLIGSGRKKGILKKMLAGADEGTLILPSAAKLRGRKRWIAFFHHPDGQLVVDDGAKAALRKNGKSLLAKGVVRIEGEFQNGDIASICDADGTEFGRGMVSFDATEFREQRLQKDVLVHRNNLVIL
ncbi:Glutamate 5-kinase [Candidatus Rhodobacter oscarellae]|uniref:Glutamate 5-kinase n=1 Tax=Candidatus Rhodobacter oscarellae TaxID=1675527 RepID=A0A0J9DZX7_9RHOB|nr:Glutamate 5-kinase [Candidatus Rhodobacter lobularis]